MQVSGQCRSAFNVVSMGFRSSAQFDVTISTNIQIKNDEGQMRRSASLVQSEEERCYGASLKLQRPKGAPTVLGLIIIMAHAGGREESWPAIWNL